MQCLIASRILEKSHWKRSFYPVDTGRKLKVNKTFRRRTGRLLNVLCTFSLRPVSTGSSFASLLLGIHEQILLNTFTNKGRTIFQAALVGCFCKERLLN